LCLGLVTLTQAHFAGVQDLAKLQIANLEIVPGLVPLHWKSQASKDLEAVLFSELLGNT